MFNSFLFFSILGIIWFFFIINLIQKRRARLNRKPGVYPDWGTGQCLCGSSRPLWKPMAMDRAQKTVLLRCSQCGEPWEEKMSVYGSKWRPVDWEYAKQNYKIE